MILGIKKYSKTDFILFGSVRNKFSTIISPLFSFPPKEQKRTNLYEGYSLSQYQNLVK